MYYGKGKMIAVEKQRKSYSSGCKYLVVGEMFDSKRVTQEFGGGDDRTA